MAWPPSFTAGTAPTAADMNSLVNPPSCQAYVSGTVTATNNTVILVTLAAETWDWSTAMHDTSTNTARVYARGAGIYLVTARVTFPDNDTDGSRLLYVYRNSAGDTTLATGSLVGSGKFPTAIGAASMPLEVHAQVEMADGDYVEMFCKQDSGTNLVLGSGNGNTSLTLTGLSA